MAYVSPFAKKETPVTTKKTGGYVSPFKKAEPIKAEPVKQEPAFGSQKPILNLPKPASTTLSIQTSTPSSVNKTQGNISDLQKLDKSKTFKVLEKTVGKVPELLTKGAGMVAGAAVGTVGGLLGTTIGSVGQTILSASKGKFEPIKAAKVGLETGKEMAKKGYETGVGGGEMAVTIGSVIPQMVYQAGKSAVDTGAVVGKVYQEAKQQGKSIPKLRAIDAGAKELSIQGWMMTGADRATAENISKSDLGTSAGAFLYAAQIAGLREIGKKTIERNDIHKSINEGVKPKEISKTSVQNTLDPRITYELAKPSEMVKNGEPVLAKTEINKATGQTTIKVNAKLKKYQIKMAEVLDHEHGKIVEEHSKPISEPTPEQIMEGKSNVVTREITPNNLINEKNIEQAKTEAKHYIYQNNKLGIAKEGVNWGNIEKLDIKPSEPITLYRTGKYEADRPTSWSRKPSGAKGEISETFKPEDIILDTTDKRFHDLYGQEREISGKLVADQIREYNKLENEVIVKSSKMVEQRKTELAQKEAKNIQEQLNEKKSPVAERVNEMLPQGEKISENLKPTSHPEQADLVQKEILEDSQKAYNKAVFEDGGSDSLRTALLETFLKNAKEKGDVEAMAEIGSALARHGQRAGQEIEFFKASIFKDPTDKLLYDFAKNKLKNVETRFGKLKEIIKEAKKEGKDVSKKMSEVLKNKRISIVEAQALLNKITCK